MTDEEREKLERTYQMTMEMHRAFMEPQKTGEPPFIERVSAAVRVFENSSWAGKWLIRGTIGLAAIMAAVVTIKSGGAK